MASTLTTAESIKSAKDLVKYYMTKNIPSYMHGPPGVGKSSVYRQIATEESIGFIDIRLGTKLPEDLSGIPVPDLEKRLAVWLESEFWPNVDRDGEKGIIVFDELSDAPRSIQSAAYGIILDRHHLPPGWYPAAAGNRREDRAAAQTLSTALANRFAHIDVEPDGESFIEWCNENDIHPFIPAFIHWQPKYVYSMEGSDGRSFCTPRSWEQVSKVCDAPQGIRFKLIRGLIGEGPAGEFEAYLRITGLPELEDVLANPGKCPIPEEPGTKYALSSMLARHSKRSNFDKIMAYIKRPEFGRDFEICAVLDATKRDASLTETKAFTEFAMRNKDLHL